MANEPALNAAARETILKFRQVNLIIGIPSFNNAATIGFVTRIAVEGISKFLPDLPALLMNSDGGSSDWTSEKFLAQPAPSPVQKLATRYSGIPGKGTALKAIFEAAATADAQAVVVVDSDLRSITPEWVRLLAQPVLNGEAEFVAPLYVRHKYDGTITNSLAYPFTRALYGKRIRQPIGGDFGFSGNLVRRFLEEDVWQSSAAQFGIDIFMTTTAINERVKIAQAHLGTKIHDAKDPALHLVPMFRQVVGTMFSLMSRHEDNWLKIHGSEPVPAVGEQLQQEEPEPVPVNLNALIEGFRSGIAKETPFWKSFLPPEIIATLNEVAILDKSRFDFPAELWVKLVYLFAVAFNKSGSNTPRIMDSLTPVYFGRTAAFVKQTESLTSAQAEGIIEQVAQSFEEGKHFLIDAWKKMKK